MSLGLAPDRYNHMFPKMEHIHPPCIITVLEWERRQEVLRSETPMETWNVGNEG